MNLPPNEPMRKIRTIEKNLLYDQIRTTIDWHQLSINAFISTIIIIIINNSNNNINAKRRPIMTTIKNQGPGYEGVDPTTECNIHKTSKFAVWDTPGVNQPPPPTQTENSENLWDLRFAVTQIWSMHPNLRAYIGHWMSNPMTEFRELDFQVITGVDLATIQATYRAGPANLSSNTLLHALNCGRLDVLVSFADEERLSQPAKALFLDGTLLHSLLTAPEHAPWSWAQIPPKTEDVQKCIKKLVDLWPEMRVDTLMRAWRCSRPDLLLFLLHQKPELHSHLVHAESHPNSYLLYYVMTVPWASANIQDVENVIKCLVELWPKSVLTPMGEDGYPYYICTPLQLCHLNFNGHLMDFLIDNMPSTVKEFCLTEAGLSAQNGLDWIGRVLPNVTERFEFHGGDQCAISCRGISDLLRLILLTNNHIPSLELRLVGKPFGQELRMDRYCDVFSSLLAAAPAYHDNSNIRNISLSVESELFVAVLDFISHMPRLETLEVTVENTDNWKGRQINEYFTPSAQAISRLIGLGNLRSLKMIMPSLENGGMSMFLPGHDEPRRVERAAVLTILDALKQNAIMSELIIQGLSPMEFSDYDQKILEVLTEQAALQTLELQRAKRLVITSSYWKTPPAWCFPPMNKQQAFYFLKLNQCGRKKARDPNTPLVDFLDILHLAGTQENMYLGTNALMTAQAPRVLPCMWSDDDFVTSLGYELLLDAVGIWANPVMG